MLAKVAAHSTAFTSPVQPLNDRQRSMSPAAIYFSAVKSKGVHVDVFAIKYLTCSRQGHSSAA